MLCPFLASYFMVQGEIVETDAPDAFFAASTWDRGAAFLSPIPGSTVNLELAVKVNAMRSSAALQLGQNG